MDSTMNTLRREKPDRGFGAVYRVRSVISGPVVMLSVCGHPRCSFCQLYTDALLQWAQLHGRTVSDYYVFNKEQSELQHDLQMMQSFLHNTTAEATSHALKLWLVMYRPSKQGLLTGDGYQNDLTHKNKTDTLLLRYTNLQCEHKVEIREKHRGGLKMSDLNEF